MKRNPVLEAKGSGRCTFGAWLSLGNSFVAETLAGAGFDWVLIDMQHGSVGWNSIGPAIQAVELAGSSALVRVAANSPDLIMRALDLGAVGVVVPLVSSAEEARRAVEAMYYPPRGSRSFGPIRNYYSMDGVQAEPACIVMIETVEALENLESIAGVSGVDGLFVGPIDLSLALGLPLSAEIHERVWSAIEKVVSACAAAGVLSGCASLGPRSAEQLVRRGVQFVTLGSDLSYLKRAAREDIDLLGALREQRSESS